MKHNTNDHDAETAKCEIEWTITATCPNCDTEIKKTAAWFPWADEIIICPECKIHVTCIFRR
ncbi:hypothetical protein M0R19_04935 [Candidatus Pacearchaeota archaeon]|jgi:peptide subunit release factor 1 (eRF1)|nr:hypothetical protein [Candidatus Pacearchaeota archaeon]